MIRLEYQGLFFYIIALTDIRMAMSLCPFPPHTYELDYVLRLQVGRALFLFPQDGVD